MNKFYKTGCVFLILSFYTTFSYAASLQVYPASVNFCEGNAQAIFVKNTGREKIGTQMRLFRWTQSDNHDVLFENHDFILSPPMSIIPGGAQQLIRIVSPSRHMNDNGTEKAYRLLIDELPSNENTHNTSSVSFLIRHSVPIFTSCRNDDYDFAKVKFYVKDGKAKSIIGINNGDKYVKVTNLRYSFNGEEVVVSEGLLGYLLPKSEMSWLLTGNIKKGASVSVTIKHNEKTRTVNFIY